VRTISTDGLRDPQEMPVDCPHRRVRTTTGGRRATKNMAKWNVPHGLALHHPAAATLLSYVTKGCLVHTGNNWALEQIKVAIAQGTHASALIPAAIEQMTLEVQDKVKKRQAQVVAWNDLKQNEVSLELKISPVVMILHKPRMFRAILDLSFGIKLKDGSTVPSVNASTMLSAPAVAINQFGHSLQQAIHAFAEADPECKIFMVKFNIKDGFWWLDCHGGQEWNFAYVLPQKLGEPVQLIMPSSLQMGWVKSPAYYCVALEAARGVAIQHVERLREW